MDTMKPPPIGLPTNGSSLFGYLFKVNQYETKVANKYLQTEMTDSLNSRIDLWFKEPPKALSTSLSRLISNCVLAAGEAGLKRTTDALNKLHFQDVPLRKAITAEEAALELRLALQDFRGAKNWLDNKSKCVRSILSIQICHGKPPEQLAELMHYKISNFGEWQKWQDQVFEYWNSKTSISQRLRGSYKTHWYEFQDSFDAELKDIQYQRKLQNSIFNAIHGGEMEHLADIAHDLMADSMIDYNAINNKYELQINISGSEISFYIQLNDRFRTRTKLNAIKSGVLYELSDLLHKSDTRMAITEMDYLNTTLRLRMIKPKTKAHFDAISNGISNFFENLEY